MDRKETYLGDGVYVSFDGYQIWLRVPREDGDHVIALDPYVYKALDQYARSIRKTSEKRPKKSCVSQ